MITDSYNILRTATLLVILLVGTGVASATDLYVNPDDSIQAIINNASPGDTVIIKPGTYNENVVIDVPELTVKSESGTPDDTIVRGVDNSNSVFLVNVSDVEISGLTIIGSEDSTYLSTYKTQLEAYINGDESGSDDVSDLSSVTDDLDKADSSTPVSGICLYNPDNQVENCRITNNKFSNNLRGIYGWNLFSSTISDNSFDADGGISLVGSSSNTLKGNVLDNTYGLSVTEYSSSNTIRNNKISNSFEGIGIGTGCSDHVISNNKISNTWSSGIDLSDVWSNTISDNTISKTRYNGITVSESFYNTLKDNVVSENTRGIEVASISDWNELTGNTIRENKECGIYIDGSEGCTIYNNYLNNTENVIEESGTNTWNTAKAEGKNIVGGPSLGGNYWAKPDGKGFSETSVDSDGDGICDSPYKVSKSDSDLFPLCNKHSSNGSAGDGESGNGDSGDENPGVDLDSTVMPNSSVSIELNTSLLEFGALSAGQSSAPAYMNVKNKGGTPVNVSVEVENSSDPLYTEGLYMDSVFWKDYSTKLDKSEDKNLEFVLKVPEDYSKTGTKKGSLIFWAEMA